MINPGDMIEWFYTREIRVVGRHVHVHEGERLWSTTMHRWVPIDQLGLVIGVEDGILTWLSHRGTFHARMFTDVNDALVGGIGVVPRVCITLVKK